MIFPAPGLRKHVRYGFLLPSSTRHPATSLRSSRRRVSYPFFFAPQRYLACPILWSPDNSHNSKLSASRKLAGLQCIARSFSPSENTSWNIYFLGGQLPTLPLFLRWYLVYLMLRSLYNSIIVLLRAAARFTMYDLASS